MRRFENRKPVKRICVIGLSYNDVENPIERVLLNAFRLKQQQRASLYFSCYPYTPDAISTSKLESITVCGETFWKLEEFLPWQIEALEDSRLEEVIFIVGSQQAITQREPRVNPLRKIESFFANDPLYEIKILPNETNCICFFYGGPHKDLEVFIRGNDIEAVKDIFEE